MTEQKPEVGDPSGADGSSPFETGVTPQDLADDPGSAGEASASDRPNHDLDSQGGDANGGRDGDKPLEPIRVYRDQPDGSRAHDLRLVGSGFDADEGAIVTFRIGAPTSPLRLGAGQARISGGGFDVLFPAILDGVYKPRLVHIDSNKSGGCDDGDDVWSDYSLNLTDTTMTIKPGDIRFRKASSGTCAYITDWPQD